MHESYDGQHRTRAGNAGDGTATTASGAGRAPVNGLPSAASGLEALLDELDAAMSATAGTCAGGPAPLLHVARDVDCRVSIVCRGCEPEDPAQNSCFSHETDGFLVSDFRIFRELEFCTVQNSRKA